MTRYERIKKVIEELPVHHRRYCTAKQCACVGCVNVKGISKSEFEKWKNGDYDIPGQKLDKT